MVRGRGQQRGLDAASDGGLRGSDDREHHGAYAGYRRRWGPHPGQPADSPAPQQDMHVIAYHHDDHDSAADHLQLLHHDHVHHSATDHDHLQLDHDDHVHHPTTDHDHLQLDHDDHVHHQNSDEYQHHLHHDDHAHQQQTTHNHPQEPHNTHTTQQP